MTHFPNKTRSNSLYKLTKFLVKVHHHLLCLTHKKDESVDD